MIAPDDPRHGTARGYVLGCRLDCCRRAQMVYMKRYRMGQTPSLIDPTGTVRRIHALHRLGYSAKQLGAMVGKGDEWTRHMTRSTVITTTNAALVADLYERLSMTPATHKLADRIRRESAAKGWAPPLAWDDIDDPDERPYRANSRHTTSPTDVDPVVVQRVLAGDLVPTTQAERVEITARWETSGRSLAELERLTGWKSDRYTVREDGAA